jgi:hypothetical protein
MVHIPEGQTGETWEPSKNNALFGWIQMYLNFFLVEGLSKTEVAEQFYEVC